jgi:dTDP-4-amino-4,6-dideoxygalactose transaminase
MILSTETPGNNKKRENYLPFGKPDFTEAEFEAVMRVMKSGWIGMGNEVSAFEQELAEYLDVPHVITVDSCTSALFLSLKAQGIKEGDEVVISSLTWCSSANAAVYCGAKPVFADIDEKSLLTTTENILAVITPRTKAIVMVHYGGLAFEVSELRNKLPENIIIVEDAAHALGASFKDGKKVGSSGNLTCFSFYANKNLSTGEGGAIALKDDKTADLLRSLRQHGMPVNAWKRFINPKSMIYSQLETLGYKMNYIDLHACIGRIQLKRFNEMQKTRHAIALRYSNELQLPQQSGLTDEKHAKHLYVVKLPIKNMKMTRDEFLLAMRDRNIGASIHYMPLHMMNFYRESYGIQKLPVSEKVFDEIITLPISASMTSQDVTDVIENIKLVLNA